MNISLICGAGLDGIKNWFSGWFGGLLAIIPKIFYQLVTAMFALLDLMQLVTRKLAGLDVVYGVGQQQAVEGDLVTYFINMIFTGEASVLKNIFWSMIILGVVMLVITTFIAVLRSEYTATDAKSASKGKIIGNALKAIASFAVVPVTCFFGMFLCNVILQAVDQVTVGTQGIPTDVSAKFATSTVHTSDTNTSTETYYHYSILGVRIPTKSTPISGLIFKAAAYSSNRARSDEYFYNTMMGNNNVALGVFNIKNGLDAETVDYNTNLIDDAFANCYKLKEPMKIDRKPFIEKHMFPLRLNVMSIISDEVLIASDVEYIDKNNTTLVWYYYDLFSFDYIICIGSLVFCMATFLYICFGLIKRVFELLILFMISAPLASLMPLDNGNALKKWREKFVSKAIGVYGPVVGLNLFFVILALLSTFQLTGFYIVDKIVNLFFTVAGLSMIKDFSALISELIGGDDTMKAGADKAESIGAGMKKVGTAAAATMALGAGVMKAGIKTAKWVGNKASKGASAIKSRSEAKKNVKADIANKVTDEEMKNSVEANPDLIDVKDNAVTERALQNSGVMSISNWYNNMSPEEKQRRGLPGGKWEDLKGKEKRNVGIEHDRVVNNTRNRLKNNPSEGDKQALAEARKQLQQEAFDSMSDEDKAALKDKTFASMSDEQKENLRQTVAKTKYDNMSRKEKSTAIGTEYENVKNNKIRERAERLAGGADKFAALSKEDQGKLLKQGENWSFAGSKGGAKAAGWASDVANSKFAQSKFVQGAGKVALDAKNIIFGKEANTALGKAFEAVGKRAIAFTSNMFAQMSGSFMKGASGGLDAAWFAFRGKNTKEIKAAAQEKEQKNYLKAQDAARKKLDPEPKKETPRRDTTPSPVKLDADSINKLARATAQQNQTTQVKLDSTSISQIGRAVADNLKKDSDDDK